MDSIIFDVDGTLWDSTENVAKAWSDCIQQDLGLSMEITAERLHQLFGKVLPEIAARIFPKYDKETQLSYINKCCDKEHEYLLKYGNPTFDKVEETLKILSEKYKLFIVSNCQSGYIEVFLKVTGLSEYFTDYLCSGDTGNQKGANIQEIIERNQLSSAVYVGDTLGDHQACQEAGVPFVYASYGFGEVPDFAYTIEQFSDLSKIF